MAQIKEPIQQLNEIRNLMERSSRFLSLSGLSGIFAGIIALLGAGAAFFYLRFDIRYFDANRYFANGTYMKIDDRWIFIVADALIVLVLALLSAVYFTSRRAGKKGEKVWDRTAKRLVINLLIPLATGGIFCLILIFHHLVFLVAPATLIFYGMALLNASKYTLPEIRVLGVSEIILGLIASFFVGYGLIFWAFGFGILHIFYGAMMYYRYEKDEL
jgi:hypothetical protein